MFSDKYLFSPHGKTIYNTVDGQIVSSYAVCPDCKGKARDHATLIEETGSMAKYLVYRCDCKTIFTIVN